MYRTHRCANNEVSHLSRYERAGKTCGDDQRHGLLFQHPPSNSAGRIGTDAGLDEPISTIPSLSNMAADSGDHRNTIRRERAPDGLEFPASRGKDGDGIHRRSREELPCVNG